MRLIDADAVYPVIDWLVATCLKSTDDKIISNAVNLGLNTARKAIADATTIDAVPVTRCKDCKHFNMQSMECENDAVSTDNEGGASYSLNFYLDDFCSYGERREENAVD